MVKRLHKKRVQLFFVKMWRNLTARRMLWGLVFFLLTLIIASVNFLPKEANVVVGQPSPKDFKASHSTAFESEVLTRKAREEAAQQVSPAYKIDPSVIKELSREVEDFFNFLQENISSTGLSKEEKIEKIQEKLGSRDGAIFILENPEQLEALKSSIMFHLRSAYEEGIKKDETEEVKNEITQKIMGSVLQSEIQPVAKAVLKKLNFKPNMEYDPIVTSQMVEEAKKAVEPVQVTIYQGEKIVYEGEIVTEAHIEALRKLGMLRSEAPYLPLLGLAIFILMVYMSVLFYLYRFKKEIYKRDPYFILLGLIIIVVLILARVVTAVDFGTGLPLGGYLIPLAAGSMLIAILLDAHLAIFITVVIGILAGVMTGNNLQFSAVAVAGGLAGVFSVSHLSQRGDFVKASLFIMLANTVVILALGLILRFSLDLLFLAIILGIVNGMFSSVLTIGSLPFLETTFGITSSVKLLEISNPNQPVLKRLLLNAPGTYHHSIMVANLAEAAADAVGADSLLVRVGAYYHDLGKLKRPYFFVENQLAGENPHDRLSPTLSTLIITSHIKDGLEIAREEKLPEVVTDIIEQHHGTGLLSYFYHKAVESGFGSNITEKDFRYDSPKPRTKEAAIVMLADSVEAGVRSLQNANPGRMEGFVRKVIREKLEDGQLDHSDLTFKELNTIASAFVRILSGAFHSRIEYPELALEEVERRKKSDGVARSKSAG